MALPPEPPKTAAVKGKISARHTTPQMRRFIQDSPLSVRELSQILNISEATVRKWRRRSDIEDRDHTPHHLNTTLTPAQEYVVVGLRYQLKLTLDKLLEVTRTFINPAVSRSGLARCLKRHNVSRIGEIEPSDALPQKHFTRLPVYRSHSTERYTLNATTLARTLGESQVVQVEAMHIPLPQGPACSVMIGLEPQLDWVYVDIYSDSDARAADRYIAYVLAHGPYKLRRLLARNYRKFLIRFPDADINKALRATPDPLCPDGNHHTETHDEPS
ncbi:transcriptional regulator [Shewanella sp. GXUN23E]|uniref:transcriptional regulator n=1 Tax=Shewanella sp. GXUN23E TaxID=3422498 RepID=UPI003D7F085D